MADYTAISYTPRMIAEYIRGILAGDDPADDFNVETEHVKAALDFAIQDAIASYWSTVNSGSVLGSWLKPVVVEPKSYETICGRPYYYIDLMDLGFTLLQLPMDRGVWQITDETGAGYTPVEAGYLNSMGQLPSAMAMSRIAYWTIHNKLYFFRKPHKCVTLYCVPSCRDAGDDDVIALPPGLNNQILDIATKRCLQMMHQADYSNDGRNGAVDK